MVKTKGDIKKLKKASNHLLIKRYLINRQNILNLYMR